MKRLALVLLLVAGCGEAGGLPASTDSGLPACTHVVASYDNCSDPGVPFCCADCGADVSAPGAVTVACLGATSSGVAIQCGGCK